MYPFKGKGLFRIVWILVTVLVVCLAGCAPHTRDDSNLQIHVLSAGQADAVLIRHETGDFLIDSGDSDGTDRLLSQLQKFHVRRLEALILTHPHEDHIGGTPVLLETLPVACIYDNGQESESPVYAHYRKIAAQKVFPVNHCSADISLPGPMGWFYPSYRLRHGEKAAIGHCRLLRAGKTIFLSSAAWNMEPFPCCLWVMPKEKASGSCCNIYHPRRCGRLC